MIAADAPQSTLTRRRMLAAAGLSVLGADALPAWAAAQQTARTAAGSRPNLILFFPDELRADALACYGNPVTRTPNFDRLAQQGTRFENCEVQYPVCGASRCSLLTGWPTSVRGHRSLYYFLRPDEPNMFRYLKNAGYDVFWFGKNDALAQETFASSVTEWHDATPATEMARPLSGPQPTGATTMLMPSGGDRRQTADYALLQMAFKVLERKEQDRPFCIFLPIINPHPPYRTPDGFDIYKAADLPPLAPPDLPKKPNFFPAIRERYGLKATTDAEFRQVRATYYGQVGYTDWLLGELLEALERTGRAADTAVITSSDHGDYTGDYGLIEKWPSGLESCLTHVPLIARVPGAPGGQVSHGMNELYDIMPTFLELAGTRATHTHFARSLLPQIHGAPGDPDRAAFSEGGYNIYEPQAFEPRSGGIYGPKTNLQNDQPDLISRCASVKTQRYTYIARPGGQSELYDRAADPQETRNLIDDHGHDGVREALQVRLMDWYIDTTGVPPEDRDPRDLPQFSPGPSQPFDAAQQARLLDR